MLNKNKKGKHIDKDSSACKKNIFFLKYLQSVSIKKRNNIIKKLCSNNELKAIIEIFLNFFHKNIHCKKSFIRFMKKYSNYFKKIINKSITISKKRILLTSKTGGFILTTLLNLALPLISRLFLKKK